MHSLGWIVVEVVVAGPDVVVVEVVAAAVGAELEVPVIASVASATVAVVGSVVVAGRLEPAGERICGSEPGVPVAAGERLVAAIGPEIVPGPGRHLRHLGGQRTAGQRFELR